MKLGLDSFRAIKPVGCIDDYVAGHEGEKIKKLKGEAYLSMIMKSITGKYLSALQVSKITGKTRNAARARLEIQLKKGNVISEIRKIPGVIKPTFFYTAAKAA